MAKQKFYVVWVGNQPGIYSNWSECQAQVNGFEGAKFKAFASQAEAEQAYAQGWQAHWGKGKAKDELSAAKSQGKSQVQFQAPLQVNSQAQPATKSPAKHKSSTKSFGSTPAPSAAAEPKGIDYHTISVDVGTAGNPGPIEYKGVDTATGEMLFSVGPIPNGTNNLGEYLAIVHALAYIAKTGDTRNIYTDSMTAMKWVKQKSPNTTLPRNAATSEIWKLVDRATDWLNHHTYTTKIMKWQTDRWGEIKADYGRK